MALTFDPLQKIDWAVAEDIDFYLRKTNEMHDFRVGLRDSFEAVPGMNWNTEFSEPNVCMDPRLTYIAKNIGSSKRVSGISKVVNICVTHFYGGYGVLQVMLAEPDPKKALIDCERIAERDEDYIDFIRQNLISARELGYKCWNRWSIRTSLQDQGHKYCEATGRGRTMTSMLEWLASWSKNDVGKRIMSATTLKEGVQSFTSQAGIGAYYGFHSGTSQSSNKDLPYTHGEPFVMPGPGAVTTLKRLFPGITAGEWSMSDRCVWIYENQEKLFPNLSFHEHWHNLEVDGKPVYPFKQDRLTPFNVEVTLCQYGAFDKLRTRPHIQAQRQFDRPDLAGLIKRVKEHQEA